MEHCTLEHLNNCPLCASKHAKHALNVVDFSVSKEIFELVDCADCGFRFTNPRPNVGGLSRYYQSENYISHSNANSSLQDRLYQLARKFTLRGKYQLLKAYQPIGKVLDIGCGTGQFLAHLMSRGYSVQGIEPSLNTREGTIANYGIRVVPSINDIPHQEQFNIVTMWHVLEHIPDLRSHFKKLFALMADKGILIIAVPDRSSWDAQHYGPNWAAWDVPRHLSHFRQKDIHTLLDEHGFTLLQTKRMWIDAFYIAMLSEQYIGHGKLGSIIMGIAYGTWSNILSLLGGRPTSSTLYIAKKIEA